MSEKDTIKEALREYISIKSRNDIDVPYMMIGNKSYSLNQILEEIENDTDFGKDFIKGVVILIIDFLTRGKKEITL